MGYVLSWEKLERELSPLRGKRRIVFTNGCFDWLHVGHVRYLQEARSFGDLLAVGLNTDESVRRLKGSGRPVQNESDRAEILAALRCVDYSVLFSQDTPYELIKIVRPDVLVKGGDWPIGQIVGGDIVQAYGGQVLSLHFVEGKSTTNLISKARASR